MNPQLHGIRHYSHLTPSALQMLQSARNYTEITNHTYTNTGHLLLAILNGANPGLEAALYRHQDTKALVRRTLDLLQVDLSKPIETPLTKFDPSHKLPTGDISDGLLRTLERAGDIAVNRHDPGTNPEHLLLAMLEENHLIGTRVLRSSLNPAGLEVLKSQLLLLLEPEKPQDNPYHQADNTALRERSGEVTSTHPLVTFLYLIIRDHLPAGTVEAVVREVSNDQQPTTFTNGYLAQYAQDLAERLQPPPNQDSHTTETAGGTDIQTQSYVS
jgi:ATP-dependent Clp protease ATP-binding subunit ClpA